MNTVKCCASCAAKGLLGPIVRWHRAPSTRTRGGPCPRRSKQMVVPSAERTVSAVFALYSMVSCERLLMGITFDSSLDLELDCTVPYSELNCPVPGKRDDQQQAPAYSTLRRQQRT